MRIHCTTNYYTIDFDTEKEARAFAEGFVFFYCDYARLKDIHPIPDGCRVILEIEE